MQGQILEDDDCACLLVEAIAKKSQNIKWSTKVDGKNVQHRLIRRVSMDQFYAILTGEEDAFYKMCMALPEVINSVVNEEGGVEVPHDTVIDELRKVASLYGDENDELSMAMAVYMLGFNTYMGFGDKIRGELGESKDGMLKRIYEYVKRVEEAYEEWWGMNMSTSTHDLFDFFKKANSNISDEYTRICRRVNEDPGTAGDQGEENWKELLESWIPPYFQIVTKGRILSDSGETSPQVDVIVLSPDYPKSLLNCKEYLSGGVVAAFECKTTLRRKHIGEFIEHSKKIEKLAINENGTPRKDLQSKIYYGLLAHSHEWKKENSNPKENIEKAIWEYDEKYVTHPREIPDIICVADLGVWKSQKMIVPNYDNGKGLKGNYVMSGYIASDNKEEFFTPVGSCVFDLLQNIAWRYPSVRDIVTYMRKLNISGSGSGYSRPWEWSILSEETQENIYRLKNGGFWNEWGMVID